MNWIEEILLAVRVKTAGLSCREQLPAMLFGQLTMRSSLRELVVCLNGKESGLYHCGLKDRITRSTAAGANSRRDWRVFMDLAMGVIRTDVAQDSPDPRLKQLVRRINSKSDQMQLVLFKI